jgi:hypothetical protein
MAGDSFFNNVVSLLHFNGADASTTFTDVKGKVWTASGNAQIDTAQSKFGGASVLFDGAGDAISTPSHVDFNFGTGDFTIEFWVRPAALGTVALIDFRPSVTNGHYPSVFLNLSGGAGSIGCFINSAVVINSANSVITTGAWFHVALCRASNNTRLFVNGVQVGSTYADANNYPQGRCYVAASSFDNGTAFNYNGHIDDIRITKGYARYIAGFTPPTAEFPDTAGEVPSTVGVVSLLHFQNADNSQIFTDVTGKEWSVFGNAKNSITQSKFGGLSGYFDGSGDYIASAHPDFGFGDGDWTWESWVRPDAVVAGDAYWVNVVARMRFDAADASTTITDAAGGTWSAIGNAQIDTAQSKWGGSSLLLDGTNDRIEGTHANYVNFALASDWTMEGWFRFNTWSGNIVLFESADSGTVYWQCCLDAAVGARLNILGSDLIIQGGTTGISTGVWMHVAFVREGGTLRAYVDGVQRASGATAASIPSLATDKIRIGENFNGNGDFNGWIDDIRLTKGTCRYPGGTTFTPPTEAFPDVALAPALCVFDTRAAGASGLGIYSINTADGNKWGIKTNAGVVTSGSVLTADVWAHLAVAKQGTTIRGFKDGVLDFTYTDARTYALSALATVGANGSGAEFYKGYLDEMRITKGEARYTAGFTPPVAAFPDPSPSLDYADVVLADNPIAYYRLNETSGTTATDSSGHGRNGTYASADMTLGVAGLLTGASDKAAYFNPTTDSSQVDCNFNNDLTLGCTLEAIVNIDATQLDTSATIITKRQFFAGAHHEFPLSLGYQASDGKLYFALDSGIGNFTTDLVLSADISTGVAHHVAGVYRPNGACELWVDGVKVAFGTFTGSIGANGRNWLIGASHGNGGGVGQHRFKGTIDEAAIYSAPLSAARVAEHYAAFAGLPSPGGGGGSSPVTHAYAFIA